MLESNPDNELVRWITAHVSRFHNELWPDEVYSQTSLSNDESCNCIDMSRKTGLYMSVTLTVIQRKLRLYLRRFQILPLGTTHAEM